MVGGLNIGNSCKLLHVFCTHAPHRTSSASQPYALEWKLEVIDLMCHVLHEIATISYKVVWFLDRSTFTVTSTIHCLCSKENLYHNLDHAITKHPMMHTQIYGSTSQMSSQHSNLPITWTINLQRVGIGVFGISFEIRPTHCMSKCLHKCCTALWQSFNGTANKICWVMWRLNGYSTSNHN